MGRSDPQDYAGYHEVLNRAVWSPGEAARVLLLLLQHLDHSDGPLICGIRTFYQSRNPGTASRSSDPRVGAATGTRCVPAAATWSRPAVGPGFLCCGWARYPGPDAISLTRMGYLGPCRCSRCWRHRRGTTTSRVPPAGMPPQKAHRLGAADDLAAAPLAAAAPTGAGGRQRLRRPGPAPLWTCSTAASPWPRR